MGFDLPATSATKSSVPADALVAVLEGALGPGVSVSTVEELAGGLFNLVLDAELVRGGEPARVVVKVGPDPTTEVMTYERHLMAAEVDALDELHHVEGVPSAGMWWFTGSCDELGGRSVLVEDHLPGDRWDLQVADAPPGDAAAVRHELGRIAGRIGTRLGDRFGYRRPGGDLSAPEWPEAVASMFGAVLHDAERFGVEMPVAPDALRALVDRHRTALDEVTEPRLVHLDLWEGNLLVERGEDSPVVTGVLDPERALFGDPLAELVTPSLTSDLESDDVLLSGYADGGGRVDFDDAARARIGIMRAYQLSVMVVEATPRGWLGTDYDALLEIIRAGLDLTVDELR